MSFNIALTTSENQITLLDLDKDNKSSRVLDIVGLKDEDISLLIVDDDLNLESFQKIINDENKYYPVVGTNALKVSINTIKDLDSDQLTNLYSKVETRWILNNNLTNIENSYKIANYLKSLWIQDRNSFFDELWFLIKSNLSTKQLNIIFHDLKEPNQKQQEKGEKSKLCYSYIEGSKKPSLFEGKEKESLLMSEYDKEFSDIFNVTEFNSEKEQLVLCAKIELSPILIMAKVKEFNPIQKAILEGIFNGLNN